ncbi:Ede1p [Sugiyamaella lignohabitans]|uniref:Actin cytoskeleton-regulatory complex protein PAN1 n=1 Tax=Sugiyamaella lignohabitans TaxID=796027 RepID=A0A167FLQ2_9ASCO|nr:Ede1p [Sugiyamaella lignohabitans]ANB15458.1 Ede1p [Sugiyamaella lignohabitans]
MRSGLGASVLGNVWQLSDTNRTGRLLFPEFALAMYLCSLVLKGQSLPTKLPEKILNEVTSLVDIISFGVDDEESAGNASSGAGQSRSNVPDFTAGASGSLNSGTGISSGNYSAPQLTSQPTGGYGQQPIASQATGYPSQQQTGYGSQISLGSQTTGYASQPTLQSQATGFNSGIQPQATGYNSGIQPQATGYNSGIQPQATGYNSGIQPQATGYNAGNGIQPQVTGYTGVNGYGTGAQPLVAQPTGKPGQWGFINTPGTGLPGIEALKDRFMPTPGTALTGGGTYSSAELQGNAKIEWAITKDEKNIYDSVFSAWDTKNIGFIGGEQAINIFGKSGLNREDLETIWNLCDPGNKGKLDKDEFAVAMHLIYRRLNGYPLPSRLPPELIPPSSRNFKESVTQIKSFLRSNTGGLEPQQTGKVSYLKGRSFKNDGHSGTNRFPKDATVYKNNDDEFGGYVSSARHRNRRHDADEPKKESESSFPPIEKMNVTQLRKAIKEKKILLDAIDAKDEEDYSAVETLESRDKAAIEELKGRILKVQRELSQHPESALLSTGDVTHERRQLLRKLNAQTDLLPQLTTDVKKIEAEIAATRLELFRINFEKEHPGATIVGTGANGTITDADRRKAKSRALVKARMAALTGKPVEGGTSDIEQFEQLQATEAATIDSERQRNEKMFVDIEESVNQLKNDLERSLRETPDDVHSDLERRRWEDAIGVEEEVKQFIYSLPRAIKSEQQSSSTSGPRADLSRDTAPPTSSPAASRPSVGQPQNSQDRIAYVKAEAERRMNERLAALGITRKPKSASSAFSPPSDGADSSSPSATPTSAPVPTPVSPTNIAAKKQPPPPPKHREVPPATKSTSTNVAKAVPQPQQSEEDSSSDDDEEEAELLRLKAAQEERLRKLQQEAAERKEAAAKKAATDEKDAAKKKAKEERRAALKAEIEAAKERERAFLASEGATDSGDAEAPVADKTATSPLAQSPTQGKNPFFRPSANASSDSTKAVVSEPPVVSSPSSATATTNSTTAASTSNSNSHNPFLRPQAAQPKVEKVDIDPVAIAKQRRKQRGESDDDWGDHFSEDESSDEDEGLRGPTNPSQLASILFSMGGPMRPNSSTPASGQASEFHTPASSTSSLVNGAAAPAAAAAAAAPTPAFEQRSEVPPTESISQASNVAPAQGSSPSESSAPTLAEGPPADAPPPPPTNIPPPPPPFYEQNGAPPPPSDGPPPPPPPPPAPPAPPPPPSDGPPPPPPFPTGSAPPPPPPPNGFAPAPPAESSPAPPSGVPNISNLLGEIQKGAALKKVSTVEKSQSLGRVL